MSKLKINNLSGPAGPIDIVKDRDKEVVWENGLPKIVQLDTKLPPKSFDSFNKGVGGPFESDTGSSFYLPDLLSIKDRGWPQSGKNAPYTPEPKEEKIMSSLDRVHKKITAKTPEDKSDDKEAEDIEKDKFAEKPAKKEAEDTEAPEEKAAKKQDKELAEEDKTVTDTLAYFKETLKSIRSLYPQTKMILPKPPTYVWNPAQAGQSVTDDAAKQKPLDSKEIKTRLKVKFPNLMWEKRYDGVDSAKIVFPDDSYAELTIGQDANHLTITYNEE